MAPAEPAALVDLERDARGGVGKRGQERIDPAAVAHEGRPGARPALVHGGGEPPVLRLRAAGHHRADRVEQHQARGLDRLVRQAVETHRRDELREAVEIIHGERVRPYPAVPPMGATGPVRARNCP